MWGTESNSGFIGGQDLHSAFNIWFELTSTIRNRKAFNAGVRHGGRGT